MPLRSYRPSRGWAGKRRFSGTFGVLCVAVGLSSASLLPATISDAASKTVKSTTKPVKATTKKVAKTVAAKSTTKVGPTPGAAGAVQSLDAATVAAARGEPPARQPASGEPYRFGLLLSRDGVDPAVAAAAKEQLRGAELASAFLNDLGGIGGRPIAIVPVEAGATAESAITGFSKLVDHEVFAVIGPTLSSQLKPLAPVATNKRVLLFGASTSANGVAALSPWVRRVAFPPDVVAANVLRELGTLRPAGTGLVLAPPNDAGAQQLAASYRTAMSNNAIVVSTVDVPFTAGDLTQLGDAVHASAVDLVVPTGPPALIAETMKVFRRAGVRATVVLDPRTITTSFVEQCKEQCDQVLTAVLYDSEDTSTLARVALLRRYFDSFASAPTLAAAQGFASVQILAIALDGAVNASPSNASVAQRRDGLRVRFARGEYDTPLGIVRFDQRGEPTVNRIALGEITRVAEQSRIRTIPTVPPAPELPGVPASESPA